MKRHLLVKIAFILAAFIAAATIFLIYKNIWEAVMLLAMSFVVCYIGMIMGLYPGDLLEGIIKTSEKKPKEPTP